MKAKVKRKVLMHERIVLARRQCPYFVGEGNARLKCGDIWRVVKLNARETKVIGPIKCCRNKHIVSGVHAKLVNQVTRRKVNAKTHAANDN